MKREFQYSIKLPLFENRMIKLIYYVAVAALL